jgi:hypothetical protein
MRVSAAQDLAGELAQERVLACPLRVGRAGEHGALVVGERDDGGGGAQRLRRPARQPVQRGAGVNVEPADGLRLSAILAWDGAT